MPLEVSAGATPNPNALKLTLNRIVAERGETYRGDPAAAQAPWAKALLAVPGIVGVFGVNNFISITKDPAARWEVIVPAAEAALRHVFNEGA
jgi:hypothetical protein